jgi:hypothetical protein
VQQTFVHEVMQVVIGTRQICVCAPRIDIELVVYCLLNVCPTQEPIDNAPGKHPELEILEPAQ